MSSKSIRTRITLYFSLTLFITVITVSGITYYLLANSLRKNDRELIMSRTRDYIVTYKEGGISALNHLVSEQRKFDGDDQEMYVSVVNNEKKEIFTYLPDHLDQDHEDKAEIEQIYRDVRGMSLEKGWKLVLLLSGDENKSIIHQTEFALRQFVAEKKWYSVLPLIDNDNVEVYFARLDDKHWIQVGKSSEDREEHLTKIRNISFLVLIPFLLIGLLVSLLLSRQAIKPITTLVETIRAILSGNKEARAKVSGSQDEVDELGIQFNTLMDSNQALVKSLKSSLDNVAHDLRTPMTRFRMLAEEALVQNNSDKFKEALSEGVEASDRIMQLLSAILDETEAHAGVMKLRKEKIHLNDFFENLKELFLFVAEEKNIEIHLKLQDGLILFGDYPRLMRVFSNLLDNAIKYSPQSSVVEISTHHSQGELVVKIIDKGFGIPASDLNRIWERLYRVDQSRSTQGFGIGLSVVEALVKAHGGRVKVESQLNVGSTFTITLPNCNEAVRES